MKQEGREMSPRNFTINSTVDGMNVAILGLGYVGCITMAAFAYCGHKVVGVDVNAVKVKQANSGRPTVIENGLDEMMADGYAKGLVRATMTLAEALEDTGLVMLCIGTPEGARGKPDLTQITASLKEIANLLTQRKDFLTIAIRSTVPPGFMAQAASLVSDISGKQHEVDFAMVANPEFIREGCAMEDFFNPPHVVIASESTRGIDMVKQAYAPIIAPVAICSVATAELIKYVNNSFHALKVAFGNEIGQICKEQGVDSHELMELFCQDDKLNISRHYLMPGPPYGGSCLPKDLAGLLNIARNYELETPLLASIKPSNELLSSQIGHTIQEFGKKNIGILGISFKNGTDDVRNSPIIEILEQLIGRGYTIRIYDPNVSVANLIGVNRDYLLQRLPVISKLISDDLDSVIRDSEVIVCHSSCELNIDPTALQGKIVYDLNRQISESFSGDYHGLAW
jgi:GDP-mannose 6-dehydrogenase